MRCEVCGKEIDEFDYMSFEPLGCDGEFIHKKCIPEWNKFCDRINNMTDDEFSTYMKGGEA